MLRISRLADYGTVVMHYLAAQGELGASASCIAKHTQVKLPTVSKLLKLLQQAGLVAAERGAKGGYHLAKPMQHISVAEIVAAVDGGVALTKCSQNMGCCEHDAACGVKENWQLINRIVMTALQSVTLADMAGPMAAHPLVRQGIAVTSKAGIKFDVVVEKTHGER